jgi:hypothetical protein
MSTLARDFLYLRALSEHGALTEHLLRVIAADLIALGFTGYSPRGAA